MPGHLTAEASSRDRCVHLRRGRLRWSTRRGSRRLGRPSESATPAPERPAASRTQTKFGQIAPRAHARPSLAFRPSARVSQPEASAGSWQVLEVAINWACQHGDFIELLGFGQVIGHEGL